MRAFRFVSSIGAVGLAMFMDIAVGIFIASAFVATGIFESSAPHWFILAAGGVLAVLPDFDLIFPIIGWLFTGKNYAKNHHETVMHWPLFLLPVAGVVGGYFGGPYFALMALACVLWHFLHDASIMGPNDSIRWLFRTRPSYWSLIGKVDPSFIPMAQWLQKNWLRPTRLSLIEIGLGSVALGSAATLEYSILFGAGVLLVVWAYVASFWILRPKL